MFFWVLVYFFLLLHHFSEKIPPSNSLSPNKYTILEEKNDYYSLRINDDHSVYQFVLLSENTPLFTIMHISTERFEHPGLIFPDSPLHPINNLPPEEPQKKRKKTVKHRPIAQGISTDWGLTTHQIAKRLNISTSAVRQYMHRHNVLYKLIKNPLVGPSIIFWEKKQALKAISIYPKKQAGIPEGFITGKDACMLLNTSNTSLTRICSRYKVSSRIVKYAKNDVPRHHRVYKREHILKVLKLYQNSGFYTHLN